jgi:zinc transport system substrate-binding protein
MSKKLLTASLAIALLGAIAACDIGGSDDGRPRIVASFYPLAYLAQRIGGDDVHVINLTKAGAEPHDLELRPSDVAVITDADLVLYLRGFQPALDDAVDEHGDDHALNALKSSDPNGDDPHVWLDPARYSAIAEAVTERLVTLAPDHESELRQRGEALRDELSTLDTEYRDGLAPCRDRTIVTAHEAFGYLAERYQLTQNAITGLDPESEPSPGRLAEITDYINDHNIHVLFTETLLDPSVAETIAETTGAATKVLDPIEGIKKNSGETYFTVARSNLATLRASLECA